MFRGQYVRTSAHTFCKCHVSQYIMHYTSPNRRISQRIPACPGNSESWHLLFEHTEQGGQVDLPTCPPPGGGTGAAGRRVRGIRERGTSSIFYATYAELNWLKLRVFLERSQVPDQVGTKKNLKPLRER